MAAAAIGTMLAITAPLSAAKPVLELSPSSAPTVHYDTDRCIMGREFGQGDEKVLVMFESFAPGQTFEFSLAGKLIKFNGMGGEAVVQFGAAEQEQKQRFIAGNLGEDTPAAFFRYMHIAPPTKEQLQQIKSNPQYRLEPISAEREAAVKTITITGPFKKNLIFKTSGWAKAFVALRKCSDDLAASWGIDVTKHADLQRRATPKKSESTWIVSEDYPQEMLNQGKRSLIQFRLMIDNTGNPTSCHIQKSNRLKEFDDTVCKALMRRARFDPALAKDGTPIASYYINSVFFQIPG